MKKSLFYIATAALALVSCNEEELVNAPVSQAKGVLTATFNQDAATRTSINGDSNNALTWSTGDAIAVFSGSQESAATVTEYTLTDGQGSASGTFEGVVISEDKLGAVFPYSEKASLNNGALSIELPNAITQTGSELDVPMWGKIDGGNISFKHLAGLLKVNLTEIPEGYNQLTVTADKPISGTFTANTSDENPGLVSNSNTGSYKTVTVTFTAATSENNDAVLYLPLPIGTYESIVVSVTDGTNTKVLKQFSDINVERAKVYATTADVDTYVTTESALRTAVAKEGVVNLGADITITEPLVISAAVTLNGNNFTIENTTKGTDARAINVNVDGNVVIKNLKVVAAGERAINVIQNPATLTLDNVTATAANYALNVATSASSSATDTEFAPTITIKNSTLTGKNTVNITGKYVTVEIENSTIYCVDNTTTTTNDFGAISISDASNIHVTVDEKTTINVTEGSDSFAAQILGDETNTISFPENSGYEIRFLVAAIQSGDYAAGYTSLEDALNAVKSGETIKLVRNIILTETVTVAAEKLVTINLNGKTLSQEKECTSSYSMIKIEKSAGLTITGEGTIRFTDTSAGGSSVWGTYIIENHGTLVVENGLIEHLGSTGNWEDDRPTNIPIQNYQGSVVINGGTISSPQFRSLRDFTAGGTIEINGGVFQGQVWMQGLGTGSSSLTIKGGNFSPVEGYDGSSVYINNGTNDIMMSVTGGMFNTKIGCAQPERTGATQSVSGGTFTQTAKDNTSSSLLATGYVFKENENGTFDVVPQSE